MRLATQVQARKKQRAAENWLKLLLLVVAHERNLARRMRAKQAQHDIGT